MSQEKKITMYLSEYEEWLDSKETAQELFNKTSQLLRDGVKKHYITVKPRTTYYDNYLRSHTFDWKDYRFHVKDEILTHLNLLESEHSLDLNTFKLELESILSQFDIEKLSVQIREEEVEKKELELYEREKVLASKEKKFQSLTFLQKIRYLF